MKKNMGTLDSGIRIAIAVIFAILFFTGIVTGVLGTILLIVGGVFIATSVVSFCPLYALIGVNTCSVKK
ncbi:MAG: DUF2892 domain-containing protein [Flavobacterium sp.]|nr:DUF2892 domain-containing protein [Flavobacterium sp.]